MRLIFFGTPDFALPSLQAIWKSSHKLLAVVTQPDRPQGRGQRLAPPPVKLLAQDWNVPVLQPERVREPALIEQLRALQPDAMAVAAFGQILPEAILYMPRYGCINVHASRLPKYRGAAPVNWAIINGEKRTGITIMQMDKGMDTGAILLQGEVDIAPDEAVIGLHDRLAELGGRLLVEALDKLPQGRITAKTQDESQAGYAPKLRKEDGRIDWTKPAAAIERLIRGLQPWPGAYTYLGGELLKITQAEVLPESPPGVAPGTIMGQRTGISVAAGGGVLNILRVKPQNREEMPALNFIHGYRHQLTGKILPET